KVEAAELPIAESRAFDFSSPYAVSKAAQENLAALYEKLGLECVVARPFNHIGPGQQPGFLVPDLCKQIVELEKDAGRDVLKVGNLTSKRDFTDVRDVVAAYELLMDKGRTGGVYNVCSGRSVSGQRVLDTLLGMSTKQIRVEEDPARMRPSDIPDLYGDFTKLHADTGWERTYALKDTLRDTLEYWRAQV
ncbi:MAG TPA: GDP-mannose 4,6-dehydratase, partial [Candidatus Saccharimonadia bacterium]